MVAMGNRKSVIRILVMLIWKISQSNDDARQRRGGSLKPEWLSAVLFKLNTFSVFTAAQVIP
jgi:hypothetical protein